MPRIQHTLTCLTFGTLGALLATTGSAYAQSAPTSAPAKDYSKSTVVTRMMAFDKKHDGKLTRDEVTDPRFQSIFDQADTNGNGVVTQQELMTLAAKLDLGSDRAGPPEGGPDDRGGADDRGGPDNRSGSGGRGEGRGPGRGFGRGPGGGPPQPGQIMPPFVQTELKLTTEQKMQLDALQAEVSAKLATILTPEQNAQLKQFQSRGPGRGGPPGGPPSGDGPPPP